MEFRLAMEYDDKTDTYTCKGGRKLCFSESKTRKGSTGYQSKVKIYRCESCEGCPYYGKCYKGQHTKSIQICPTFDAFREESRNNMFGITKQDYSFKRFLTRGKENVATEYMLLAFAFDMNKLHYRIQNHRIGQSLFPVKDTA